jgi:hypothetical protein
MWDACQQRHKTTLNNALNALYHGYTWPSAEHCLAVKQFIQPIYCIFKNIADMADLLK